MPLVGARATALRSARCLSRRAMCCLWCLPSAPCSGGVLVSPASPPDANRSASGRETVRSPAQQDRPARTRPLGRRVAAVPTDAGARGPAKVAGGVTSPSRLRLRASPLAPTHARGSPAVRSKSVSLRLRVVRAVRVASVGCGQSVVARLGPAAPALALSSRRSVLRILFVPERLPAPIRSLDQERAGGRLGLRRCLSRGDHSKATIGIASSPAHAPLRNELRRIHLIRAPQ